jgi:hypothetical protein
MTQYFGDYSEDQTVYIPFNTFDSNDPSASVTITNLADADIKVHKDGSATQIVTDGATVSIDFDSITGNHLITIDTSVHADYATGSDYLVRIEGTTVDGATINAWVGSFSIENRHSAGALRPTTAGRTLDVAATGEAGVDLGNVTGTLTQANVGWVDSNSRVDVGSWLGTAVTTSATTAKPEVDVNSISNDATAANNLELDYDGTGYAKTNSTVGTVTTLTGHTAQTGDSYARLGAPAGASVSADIAAIEAQTDDIGVAGAGLTAIPWNASWDAEVQSEVDDALVARGLDHLVNASVTGTDITDNSIIARMVSSSATADWDSFVNTTDSLQAIRDKQTDIETDTQDLQTQVGTAGAGLTAVPWNASWDAEVESEVNDGLVAVGLDHLVSASVTGTDITDNSIIARMVSSSATADWDSFANTTDSLQAIRDKQTDIETDTQDIQTQVGTAGAGLTDLGGMSTAMKAEVNAEALDVLNTDTFAEPGQEAPGATVSLATKIGYLYKAWRNKSTQTSSTYSLFADDTTTVDQKATVSDDGTTATKAEVGTGP